MSMGDGTATSRMGRRAVRTLPSAALAALLVSAASLVMSGCAAGPFAGGGGGPTVPARGQHLTGNSRGVSFRYHLGDLTLRVRHAPESLRHKLNGSQLTARCGGVQATRRWPPGTAELTFGLHPKPAAGNSISPAPSSPSHFGRCELLPQPGTHPLVTVRMRPRSHG